jgi:hypothetical protein
MKRFREIDAAEHLPDRRHDDVLDERVDDLAEGRADDDADGEVDDVALHRELSELFQHGFSPSGVAGVWWNRGRSAAQHRLDRLERVDVLLSESRFFWMSPIDVRACRGAERAALVAGLLHGGLAEVAHLRVGVPCVTLPPSHPAAKMPDQCGDACSPLDRPSGHDVLLLETG